MKRLHFLSACVIGAIASTASAESKPEPTSAERIRVISAGELFDKDVVSSDRHDVGNVEYVLVRVDDGRVQDLIIESEMKGSEQQLVSVPFEAIKSELTGSEIQLSMTLDKINNAPRVTEDQLGKLIDPAIIEETDHFWGQVQHEEASTPRAHEPATPKNEEMTRGGYQNVPPDTAVRGPDQPTGTPMSPGDQARQQEKQQQQMQHQEMGQTEQTMGGNHLLLGEHSYRILKPGIATAEALEDMVVQSSDRKDLGRIETVVIDVDAGRVAYTLVGRGGFLGMGRSFVAVPIEAIQLTDQNLLQIKVPASKFNGMRGYVDSDVPRYVTRTDLERVYQQFRVEPYWKKEQVATKTLGAL